MIFTLTSTSAAALAETFEVTDRPEWDRYSSVIAAETAELAKRGLRVADATEAGRWYWLDCSAAQVWATEAAPEFQASDAEARRCGLPAWDKPRRAA